MRDFFLSNSFAVAQNTGAQNAQTQKSNLEAQTEQNQKSSLSLLIDAVFENPTDLEVNFKLLEEQTRVGDLRGAAATLDRILLLDPDSKLARVLLAEVQFNLGNLATAETVLISLRDDETTPPDMLERVEKNLNAIRDAQSPWRYSASFSVARGSAENPRGASASDTILLTDIEVTNDTLDESEAYGDATNAAGAFTAGGSAAFSASNSGCSGAGICTIADSVSSYTCTGSGQCTEDNHASVDTSVNASFKLLQNASTDQAAVGGINISAADNTALASSGDVTLLAQ